MKYGERKGDWIQTYSGRQFWPLDPRPEEIHIEDIAHALSLTCRYNGHCEWLYSVGQHSIYVAQQLSPELRLAGLLHDAAEAYVGDVTRPLKKHLYDYKIIESRLQTAIAVRFRLNPLVFDSKVVKDADNSVLLAEKRHLMKQPPKVWEEVGVEEAPIKINYWFPWYTRWRFLRLFKELRAEQERRIFVRA